MQKTELSTKMKGTFATLICMNEIVPNIPIRHDLIKETANNKGICKANVDTNKICKILRNVCWI
jgi:hypothetical protein